MDPDRSFFDWLGHYLGLIVLSTLLGIGGGALFLRAVSPPYEAWSVIIQSTDRIPPRELGPLAQSVFVTQDVYAPAMAEIGIEMSPDRFLSDHAELRPVPDTNALVVIGRSDDAEEARRISDRMMRSLVRTFRVRGLTHFTIFDQASPVRRQAGPPVILAFGWMIGLWLGIAAAVVHYRVRRPVLSLSRAAAMILPDQVATVRARRPRWLGVLRRPRRWRENDANRASLHRLAGRMPTGSVPVVTLVAPQVDGLAGRLEDDLSIGAGGGRARGVLVVDAGSREEDLADLRLREADDEDDGRDLVWVS